MNFGLKLRHYWSFSENNSYHKLLENGYTEAYSYTDNANQNLNLWNFDLSYSWWFAPGSQMSFLYRNASGIFQNTIDKNFVYNTKKVFNHEDLNHTFSISIRYFIDYKIPENKIAMIGTSSTAQSNWYTISMISTAQLELDTTSSVQ